MIASKTKFTTFLKSRERGYVTFSDVDFFNLYSKEVEELHGEKIYITPLVKENERIEQYDEIVMIESNKSLTTATLQAIVENFVIV